MSVMDRLINAMKINEDPYDDEPDDEFYDDEEEDVDETEDASSDSEDDEVEPEEPAPAPRTRRRAGVSRESESRGTVRRSYSESGMEVCVIRPTSVNDAREVTDTLLAGSTVVLNLEGIDVDIAQRIIDFTSGSCYAIQGNVMKISHYIFVITPANVDITGDVGAGLKEGTISMSSPFAKK